jgi:GntR family transcriptional regulator
VESVPGKGTFVVRWAEPFVTTVTGVLDRSGTGQRVEAQRRDRRPVAGEPRISIEAGPGWIARQLGLETGAQVVVRHQERRIDGVAWSLQTTYYPMTLVNRGATRLLDAIDITEGAVTYIEDILGIKEAAVRDEIRVRRGTSSEGAFFGIPDDSWVAMIQLNRTSYDEERYPVRLTVTIWAADRNYLVYETLTDNASNLGPSPLSGWP